MEYFEDFNYIERYDTLIEDNEGTPKKYLLRGVFSRVGFANKNKRIYTKPVMEECINDLQEIIKTRGFVGELDHPPCVGVSEFSVLAKTGWKEFLDIKIGDKIATLDKNNNIIYQKVETIINEHYKGKIYHLKGRNIDVLFTGTHRLYLENRYGKREIVTVKEIFDNRKKYNKHKIIKTGNWNSNKDEKFIIPNTNLEIDTKNFMAFIGIYLSEGYYLKDRDSISISQNEGLIADKIRELLKKLPFNIKEYQIKREKNILIKWNINSKELKNYLIPLGNCYNKYIPFELKQLDAPYLEELIEWFILGDGRNQRHYKGSNRRNLFSVSKRLVEDLHECLIKCGGSGNWTEYICEEDYEFAGHTIKAENKKPLYQLNLSTTKGIYLDERFLKIEEKDHNGNVYCLTVENGNFYMKCNGKSYWTGNSPKININGISHIITKLVLAPDGAVIGEMEALDTAPGRTLKKLMEAKVRLGVSTRGLGQVRPYSGPLGEGLVEVQPGYRMKAIDIVFDPSAGTYPTQVMESIDNKILLGSDINFRKVWEDCFGGNNAY